MSAACHGRSNLLTRTPSGPAHQGALLQMQGTSQARGALGAACLPPPDLLECCVVRDPEKGWGLQVPA